MDQQSANTNAVMIELAKAAATIRAQQDVLDLLRKQVPEPITYVDLERQDHEAYERNER